MPSFRFGKHPPKADYRTLRLSNYLGAELAAPPASVDKLSVVFDKLHTNNVASLFPMDGNDTLGDCTIAAVGHAITAYHGLVGTKKIMSKAAVVKLYMHLTGGVDSGLNELDVLNHWQSTSVDGDKILAYVKVDPKNHVHVQQAIELFGAVYLGFQVQQDCIQDFDAHKPWTPGPLTNDGHAVLATGYDQDGVTVLTWGSTQKGTWGWWDECVDEAYAILAPQAKKQDVSPGVNFDQLKADLAAVAN